MYFEYFKDTFRPFFERTWENLSSCVCRSIELLTELYGLRTTVTRASELDGAPETLPAVVRTTDADTVVMPQGVAESGQKESCVTHRFTYDHPTYRQNFEGFERGMTAADLLFNYGREAQRILADGSKVFRSGDSSTP